jgi:hypothetical protein
MRGDFSDFRMQARYVTTCSKCRGLILPMQWIAKGEEDGTGPYIHCVCPCDVAASVPADDTTTGKYEVLTIVDGVVVHTEVASEET